MNLQTVERQLKKRWPYDYVWFRKQNDAWDKNSNFIYTTLDWEELNEQIAISILAKNLDKRQFFYYCCNRWYNFWSARAIEQVFTEINGIVPNQNPKDRLSDFNFFGKDFDLKTSVFPASFGHDLEFAKNNPAVLINWLYQNQSKQGRFHFNNRLFLIVYASNAEHWKLKAEISWLKGVVEEYVANFETSQLRKFRFQKGTTTFSDIIWAIK